MENKLKVTRYCLDKEDNNIYQEFLKSEAWRCGLIDPDRLLKIPKYQMAPEDQKMFDEREKDYIAGIDPYSDDNSILFHQREGDMDNLPESTITYSSSSPGELIEVFMKSPILVREVPDIDIVQAMEKVTKELNEDKEYYIAWKSAIAMTFYLYQL